MAALSITINDSLNVFAGGPSDLWNAYNWNAFKWGEGTAEYAQNVVHLVDNPWTFDTDIAKTVVHSLADQTLTLDSSTDKTPVHAISETVGIIIESETGSESLQDGSGYSYVFPSETSEAEDRDFTTYTAASSPGVTWAVASSTSSTWGNS